MVLSLLSLVGTLRWECAWCVYLHVFSCLLHVATCNPGCDGISCFVAALHGSASVHASCPSLSPVPVTSTGIRPATGSPAHCSTSWHNQCPNRIICKTDEMLVTNWGCLEGVKSHAATFTLPPGESFLFWYLEPQVFFILARISCVTVTIEKFGSRMQELGAMFVGVFRLKAPGICGIVGNYRKVACISRSCVRACLEYKPKLKPPPFIDVCRVNKPGL